MEAPASLVPTDGTGAQSSQVRPRVARGGPLGQPEIPQSGVSEHRRRVYDALRACNSGDPGEPPKKKGEATSTKKRLHPTRCLRYTVRQPVLP